MERQQVLEFIFNEAKRLIEEEHIDDLCKHKRYEELANVEVKSTMRITSYILDKNLDLTCKEISEGMYFPIAFWSNSMALPIIKHNEEKKFADKLEKEAGELGKSIAKRVYEGQIICDIKPEDFFNTTILGSKE